MRILQRIIFLFSISIIIGCIFLKYTQDISYAQSSPINSYLVPETNPDVPINLHTLTHSIVLDTLSIVTCLVVGSDPFTYDKKCLGWDSSTNKIGYVKSTGGAYGLMAGLLINSYNIPVHFSQFANYAAGNFQPFGVTRSYAQGVGAQGLYPLLKLWVGFRNVSYVLMIIVFMFVGLGVMLRIKIDPRTVMTLQNQIPKIIASLLLITFSYAIVGLLIDLTYVITFVLLNTIGNSVGDTSLTTSLVTATDPYSAVDAAFKSVGGFNAVVSQGAQGVTNAVNSIVGTAPIIRFVNGLFFVVSGIICGIASIFTISNQCGNNGGGGLVGIIVGIAIYVALLGALFRFWISLISCYLSIIFNLILGPLRILLGILPGDPGGGFAGWMRDLVGNLLVFPVSLAYIYVLGLIAKYAQASPPQTGFLPFITSPPHLVADANLLFQLPMQAYGNAIGILTIAGAFGLTKVPELTLKGVKAAENVIALAFGQNMKSGIGTFQKATGATVATVAPSPKPGEKGGPWVGVQRLIG